MIFEFELENGSIKILLFCCDKSHKNTAAAPLCASQSRAIHGTTGGESAGGVAPFFGPSKAPYVPIRGISRPAREHPQLEVYLRNRAAGALESRVWWYLRARRRHVRRDFRDWAVVRGRVGVFGRQRRENQISTPAAPLCACPGLVRNPPTPSPARERTARSHLGKVVNRHRPARRSLASPSLNADFFRGYRPRSLFSVGAR